jgi:imidazolonepropionase
MSLACTHFRLTPAEALRGATVHAARALGLADRGGLASACARTSRAGACSIPSELAYWLGGEPARGTGGGR